MGRGRADSSRQHGLRLTSGISAPYIHTTLKLDEVALSIVRDGTIRVDGGALYGAVPKVVWNTLSPADKRNRVAVGLNCLLVCSAGRNILVDTGVGNKHPAKRKQNYAMKAGELVQELRAHSLGVDDIDIVVLSHLHFDRAGGCTKRVHGEKAVPTFPRATYLVQKKDWYEATHASERSREVYVPDDFLPLQEHNQLELLDGDTEIAPNVRLKVTGGHTMGHQMVSLEAGGQRVVYLGDLLPTPHHLLLNYITAWDIRPVDTLNQKRHLLDKAEDERWLLIFSYGLCVRAGYLVRENGDLTLQPQEL